MKHKIQRKIGSAMLLVAVFGIALFASSDALAKCDLKVTFVAPTGNTVTSGQAVTWTLRFENIGKTTCKANKIKLSRYSGRTASGYGTAIGGSGNFQALPALAPGQSVDLSFVENNPPRSGKYTYKMRFSSRHNDSNNRNHSPTKTVTFQKASVSPNPPGSGGGSTSGKCDLETTFTAPTGNTVTSGQAVTWTLRFKNIGNTKCKANKIKLSRYSGRTARGYGVQIGGSGNFQTLPALAPGESVDLSFIENNPPNTGKYTYKMRFSSPHNDANNRNHRPTKTVTFIRGNAGTNPPGSGGGSTSGQCDLQTTFTTPTGNTVAGGQAMTWTLQFENIGGSQCAANTIKLQRYSGGTASGYGTTIGGSGNFKTLPALAPGQTANLTFVENNPPNTGTYTYKARYSSPHNDGNNFNHHPTKTVIFQAGAAPGQPDLLVESASFVVGPTVGVCNSVTVTVKNQGGLANEFNRVTVILFPTGNPFQNRVTKEASFGSFQPGQSQSRTITGLNIAALGSWTMQVVADSQQVLDESNENNNIFNQFNINVTQNCQ